MSERCDPAFRLLREALGRPAQMDAPDGPQCWCEEPSAHESGWCGRCGGDPGPVEQPSPYSDKRPAGREGE